MPKQAMPGLFAGIKVLDVASFIAAPAAATIMSDFGAEVIKIEPPGEGDPYRALYRLPGMPRSEENYCWLLDSRNKRSLALDLKQEEARDVLYRLVRDTDVFITNFPLPVRERLGIAQSQLEPLNERLIYASLTGYGETGEEANHAGFDTTAWWARSGLMDQVVPHTGSAPARSVPGMGDHPTALALFGAIMMALLRRERTGKGGAVGASLLANGVWANGAYVQAALCGAHFIDRPPREKSPNALRNHYRCRDGRWFILALVQEERHWPRFAACLGHAALAQDPRFVTRKARHAYAAALTAALDAIFAERDSAEWKGLLGKEGFTAGVVSRVTDIPSDRQMLAADVLTPMEGPEGPVLTVSSPFWVAGEEKRRPRRAPSIGEHSDAILAGLGFTPDEIAHLRKIGAVG